MKKILAFLLVFTIFAGASSPVFAKSSVGNKITGKTVVAGALSLIVWPGIGQAINNQRGEKVLTHAVLGILPPYRFWSGYDALVDRDKGYWKGRI